MRARSLPFVFVLLAAAVLCVSCFRMKVQLGVPSGEPLKEYAIEGKERGKVLVIPVSGFLSDKPRKVFSAGRASAVQEVVSRLRRAEKDNEVKAVLFEINSPGGSITASDILYREISDFKEKTGAKIVAVLMDVAASGGYYMALPADLIIAHPTTVTGSVGVLLVTPKVSGLMDKLGLAVEVSKSGSEKDIGSPFRPSTAEEQRIFQGLTDEMGKRFLDLVERHRKVGPENLRKIASARIYLADEALRLGLVDSVGYVKDGLREAKRLASLPEGARVVVYRHEKYPEDNLYNSAVDAGSGTPLPLVDINLPDIFSPLEPGFYYLWLPGTGRN